MITLSALMKSSIGKKLFMGFSGIMLLGFIIVHLVGNMTLLLPDGGAAFNVYAHTLMSFGTATYIAEFILAMIFLIHILYAIIVTLDNWKARGNDKYKMITKAGHTSRKTWASDNMIWTGLLVFIFLVKHIIDFKYGTMYFTEVDGIPMRDLYRTVVEFYGDIYNVGMYVVIMILLGLHLSHGAWSSFQSIGVDGARFTPFMVTFAKVFGSVIFFGFSLIPVILYLTGGSA